MNRTPRLALLGLLMAAALGASAQASDFFNPGTQQNYRNEERALRASDVQVEVLDARTLRTLPIFLANGTAGYVGANMGQAYKLRIYNRSGGRILAVPSVDGVNVITGQTASVRQPGYVVPAYGAVTIDGWRKSRDEVAEFVFTTESSSYAAQTGRPGNVGIIGLALFREEVERPPERIARRESAPLQLKAAPLAAVPGSRVESEDARLGTGHGERRDSYVTEVEFKRDLNLPLRTVTLEYDSLVHLEQRGIALPLLRRSNVAPRPFPADGFVPDPPGVVYKPYR